MTDFELKRTLQRLQAQINCQRCKNCIELSGCEDGQIPMYDDILGIWICADMEGGEDVTLNADQPTQDSANLTGQELQLVPATSTTYGVVKLEDLQLNIETAANYAALPDPTLNSDTYYNVLASQGTAWLPGSLGGTYYSKGFYYSNGIAWSFVGEVPWQATQADVDAGIITDQFVSPATLANAAQWDTKLNSSFTKAELDTAVSDGNVLYVGDVTSNATHTGEVTGATALTVDKTAITGKTLVTAVGTDHILIADASDSDNLKKALISDIAGSFDYPQVLFTQVFS